ncbi:MAG: hypothetical protein WC130_04405 [Kiritimatiellia bacterium]
MTLPLIVKSKLFWQYQGQLDCCWYLGNGDNTSIAKQDAYIRDMDRFGANTATLNILNEGQSTIFSGEFMASSLHEGKVNSWLNFAARLKNAGKLVVAVYFDGPQIPDSENPAYPYWKFKERIPAFLEMATPPIATVVDGFVFQIESNRGPLNASEINWGVGLIQKYAVRGGVRLPVGTHEQSYRVASNADFLGFETRNHPVTQGDSTSVADMVSDVRGLTDRAGGKCVWVMESNSSEGDQAKKQNRALAALSGVVGVSGPM